MESRVRRHRGEAAGEAIKDAEASEKILRAILDAIWLVSMEVEQFEAAEEKHTSAPATPGRPHKAARFRWLIAQNLAMEQLRGELVTAGLISDTRSFNKKVGLSIRRGVHAEPLQSPP